jgi:hypothetical protein
MKNRFQSTPARGGRQPRLHVGSARLRPRPRNSLRNPLALAPAPVNPDPRPPAALARVGPDVRAGWPHGPGLSKRPKAGHRPVSGPTSRSWGDGGQDPPPHRSEIAGEGPTARLGSGALGMMNDSHTAHHVLMFPGHYGEVANATDLSHPPSHVRRSARNRWCPTAFPVYATTGPGSPRGHSALTVALLRSSLSLLALLLFLHRQLRLVVG